MTHGDEARTPYGRAYSRLLASAIVVNANSCLGRSAPIGGVPDWVERAAVISSCTSTSPSAPTSPTSTPTTCISDQQPT
eukprot:7183822-Prymnesium_polylepis.1